MRATHTRSSSWPRRRSSLRPCSARCSRSRCWSGWSWWSTARWCRPSLCWARPPSGPIQRHWICRASRPSLPAGTASCPFSPCWRPRRSPRSLRCCTRYKPANGLPGRTRTPAKPEQRRRTRCSGPASWRPDPTAADGRLWASWRDCWFPVEDREDMLHEEHVVWTLNRLETRLTLLLRKVALCQRLETFLDAFIL